MRILADIRQIDAIIEVLKDNEGILSDGYEYYCKRVNATLEKIAIDIIENFNKVI